MKYNKYKRYENLYDKQDDKCVVDLMLHTGEIVEMCIMNVNNKTFDSVLKYMFCKVKEYEISKIRLTHKIVKRYQHHNWGGTGGKLKTCICCGKKRIPPLRGGCSIIRYYNYREASPYHQINKRHKVIFDKTQEIIFPPL